MSKLSDFYAQRQELLKDNGQIEIEDNLVALEEKLLREELMPTVGQTLLSLLRDIKTPLSISINYMPDGKLAMSFVRNSLMISLTDKAVETSAVIVDPKPVETETDRIEENEILGADDMEVDIEEREESSVIAVFQDGKMQSFPGRP